MKILVWGTSGGAQQYQKFFDKKNIVGYIETSPKIKMYKDMPLYNPDEIKKVDYDFIFCASIKTDQIITTMIDNDIPLNKTVFLDSSLKNNNQIYYDFIRDNMPDLFSEMEKKQVIRVKLPGFDSKDKGHICHKMNSDEYKRDYFRFRTFEMIADMINTKGVMGDVAEAGVFRGTFAALINRKFPNKKLFLFDSFRGFIPLESKRELSLRRTNEAFVEKYKDTSVKCVLEKMFYKENVIIKEGFFPETTVGMEEHKFCFVSIDFDFEDSIFQAIRWFYPRLNDGGYIMLHDFWGNRHIREAVNRYEKEIDERLHFVPIADCEGTLVIIK